MLLNDVLGEFDKISHALEETLHSAKLSPTTGQVVTFQALCLKIGLIGKSCNICNPSTHATVEPDDGISDLIDDIEGHADRQ
jgi:hypothetical protein